MGLEKLLYLQGVGAEFIDCFGNHIHIPPSDREGILKSMCLEASAADSITQDLASKEAVPTEVLSPQWIEARIDTLDVAPWRTPLASFQWCYVDDPCVSVYLPDGFPEPLQFELASQTGERSSFIVYVSQMKLAGDYVIDGKRYCHYQYSLLGAEVLPLGLGYHKLTLALSTFETPFTSTLMIAPRMAYQGRLSPKEHKHAEGNPHSFHDSHHDAHHDLDNNSHQDSHSDSHHETWRSANIAANHTPKRSQPWGLSVHLYTLRSQRQWGIGDFGDLATLIECVASYGADFILLNPLHALDISDPTQASPYSPCDRRRLNPLYIQIDTLAEFASVAKTFASEEWQAELASIAEDNWLNYPAIYRLKYRAFIALYHVFSKKHLGKDTHRGEMFAEFVKQEGESLQEFATGEALRAPIDLAQDSQFYCYLQFVASEQMALCQLRAKQSGMSIGLIRDLAVGALVQGNEVQDNAEQFCLNASIGAPPDPFAPQGQNWGLTPFDPIKLKQHNYRHFIALAKANMRHCGALRIDHVMALLRLWWWPLDKALGNGAYVYYPVETLLAILCLESQRARCILIGEDLGIVPPEIVSRLHDAGIYSNELFYFCKDYHGFKSPADYKPQSLMMLANHDVPTLKAWWTGSDLQTRRKLELIDSDQALTSALTQRCHEKQQLLWRLQAQGFLSQADIESINCEFNSAVELDTSHELAQRYEIDFGRILLPWLAMAASGNACLFSVQLSDLLEEVHSVNIPGTWREYPNWQRRLPLNLSEIAASKAIAERLHLISRARRFADDDEYGQGTLSASALIKASN